MVAHHQSSVAVSPAADASCWEHRQVGRALVCGTDPKDVPQTAVKEAKNAMTPSFDRRAIVKAPAFLTGVDLSTCRRSGAARSPSSRTMRFRSSPR
jgi:hypothetical protein